MKTRVLRADLNMAADLIVRDKLYYMAVKKLNFDFD